MPLELRHTLHEKQNFKRMSNLKIGFVSIVRSTFDVALATEVTARARVTLSSAGFDLRVVDEPISDLVNVDNALSYLRGEVLDLLVIFQATFADSSLVLKLAECVNAPILCWAVPEGRTGGRLRLNSLCGINLASHALSQRGIPFEYVYANADDARAVEQIAITAKAGRVKQKLARTTLGVIGEHPAGFDPCRLDAPQLARALGVAVQRFELSSVFDRARKIQPEHTNAARAQLSTKIDNLDALDQTPLMRTLNVYNALKEISHEQAIGAFAIRCWPEFFTELGCAACGAMSLMNTEMTPCGCEADANGTMTQLILQELSGEPAFGADMVEFNRADDSAVLWHCGQAPLTMAEASVQGGIHSNRKLPLVMEFALKAGRVTLARLNRQPNGALRLAVGRGEILRAPKSFSGTSGVVRFDKPVMDVLDTVLHEGLEHHVAMAYGDHTASLVVLARMLKLPVLMLT